MTRPAFLVLLALRLGAQERPLASLPYTPSLEPAFVDRSADPCVDFYKFACGNWNQLNPIPPDQPHWDVYGKLQNDNRRYLWGILEEVSKPAPSRTLDERKIGDYFAACTWKPPSMARSSPSARRRISPSPAASSPSLGGLCLPDRDHYVKDDPKSVTANLFSLGDCPSD